MQQTPPSPHPVLLRELPTGSTVLDDAWRSFWSDFDRLREIIYSSPLYQHDERTRTDANHLIHQLLYVGHSLVVQPRQMYPTFYGQTFQWPLHNTFGMPSPDNTFGLIFLDGKQTYRLWGKRNTVHDVWIVVYRAFWGDEEDSAPVAELRLDDMNIARDGSFDITLSAERADGNWIQIDRDARNAAIMFRQTHLDWENEVDAEMHVARIDVDTHPARVDLDERALADRIIKSGRLMVHMGNMSRLTDRVVLPNAGAYNRFFDLNGPGVSAFGTFNRAHYANAVYEIAQDEALIVTLAPPGDSEFWNLQIGDLWFQTEDYVFHQTSLNQLQASRDVDGAFRFVIAHEDPGVANWLDTLGRSFGTAVWRVYGPTGAIPTPLAEVVKFAELERHLPAHTTRVSAAERIERLRRRREAAMKRWRL